LSKDIKRLQAKIAKKVRK